MGTVFEELVRRFNEENNEEAGEHWTPRDAVTLMAKLVLLPVADQIDSGTYLVYDGACGTGGMLTVAEEALTQIAEQRGKQVATHLYGQEINSETYAIAKADLLLKGEGEAADNIVGGPEHSTLSNDAFPGREFDFMLSNPPYGKSWKSDLERMGGKKDMRDSRFLIEHADDPEYLLVTRSSDGQMLFLANMLSKMKQDTKLGSRIAEVHNGSSLFTGDAGQGESNIRRWIIENDWLEAIVCLAAEHVLQHRHRHLHLGPQQQETRASPRQGPAHRRHAGGSSHCARTSARRTANCRRKTSPASATRSSPSRKPSSQRSSQTRPSGTGRSRSNAPCAPRSNSPKNAGISSEWPVRKPKKTRWPTSWPVLPKRSGLAPTATSTSS